MAKPQIFTRTFHLLKILIFISAILLIILFSSLIAYKYFSIIGTAYLVKGVIIKARPISASEKKTVSIIKGDQIKTISGSSARLRLKNDN
ncbi:MAG: hypothetical protein N2246_06345, partial [Candidatus Sumerlaeia bacterium]|nr:hypothetical protein [Candidatus Sumerlaeia bacterium]